MNSRLSDTVCHRHCAWFKHQPQHMAYAPGRLEILGNHTDYNGGLTLSIAIDAGICAAVSPAPGNKATLLALDLNETAEFTIPVTSPEQGVVNEVRQLPAWAKYIAGVAHELPIGTGTHGGFDLTFGGNIPRGAGLSSSAALETAVALALAALTDTRLPLLELARLCQKAENDFVGAQCGLLDQISSLAGAENALIAIDFQSMEINTVPLPGNRVFLIADTRVKHSLADCEYNDRRKQCEAAAQFCANALGRPIKTLRQVTMSEFQYLSARMYPVLARRARHVITENQRVTDGMAALRNGDLTGFGRLMFDSHESSRVDFENSCPELDFLVEQASRMPQTIGARLSGGGFGGSVVVMTGPEGVEPISDALPKTFAKKFSHPCQIRAVKASAGARLL